MAPVIPLNFDVLAIGLGALGFLLFVIVILWAKARDRRAASSQANGPSVGQEVDDILRQSGFSGESKLKILDSQAAEEETDPAALAALDESLRHRPPGHNG